MTSKMFETTYNEHLDLLNIMWEICRAARSCGSPETPSLYFRVATIDITMCSKGNKKTECAVMREFIRSEGRWVLGLSSDAKDRCREHKIFTAEEYENGYKISA